ncbi:MAG: phenylalanine--tRNA ligase subunit beta [bacterium]|nr:MAG: phenylalanine--tRNA ligase subunit beta [bacterium]
MKINLDWLSDYVEIRESPEELAEALTMAGLEVEGVERAEEEVVLEISVTPNRPDWLCHLGVAREVAAIYGRKVRIPAAKMKEEGPDVRAMTSIDIEDPVGCPRYSGRVVTSVRLGEAPEKVRRRLESVGIRSISNIVDATNYVMMEMGQPLHAFDYHRLAENRIVVRKAGRDEVLETLDGQERVLHDSDLLICDGLGPVALAGVMGGMDSEITDQTTDLLLESACFDPMTIRRTSKRLGLSTEASYRFERGTDPTGTARAVDRLTYLIQKWAGGTVCRGVWDAHPRPEEPRRLSFRMERIGSFLGVDIPNKEALAALRRLGLIPERQDRKIWSVEVPGYRRDLEMEEDVIEEVARIYGYDRIPVTLPVGRTVPVRTDPLEALQADLREAMEGMGFSEAITYSFIGKAEMEELGLGGGPEPVTVLNPISEDMTVMRTSILPGLLKCLRTNMSRRVEEVRLFETGRVFLPCPECELPEERFRVAALMTGSRSPKTWYRDLEVSDFFDMKGAVESLLDALGIPGAVFREMNVSYLQAGQSAWVMAGETSLGLVGTLRPGIREKYRVRQWAGCLELDLHEMLKARSIKAYRPIPQYPGLLRDLAVVVPREVEAERILSEIRKVAENLGKAELFDLYEGKGIPEGHRSLAFALTYQSQSRTLTDEEVDRNLALVVKALEEKFGAKLR